MSAEQEAIVRAYLVSCTSGNDREAWAYYHYDWMSGDVESLNELGFFPIPEVVLDAYDATRTCEADRSRDEPLYGKRKSLEDVIASEVRRMSLHDLTPVPVFDYAKRFPPEQASRLEAYERRAWTLAHHGIL